MFIIVSKKIYRSLKIIYFKKIRNMKTLLKITYKIKKNNLPSTVFNYFIYNFKKVGI